MENWVVNPIFLLFLLSNSYKNISACSKNYHNLDVSLGLDGVNLYSPLPLDLVY